MIKKRTFSVFVTIIALIIGITGCGSSKLQQTKEPTQSSPGLAEVAPTYSEKIPETPPPAVDYSKRIKEVKYSEISNFPDDYNVLYFYSPTCPACQGFEETLMAYQHANDRWTEPMYRVDVSKLTPAELNDLKTTYGVTSIPAVFEIRLKKAYRIDLGEIYAQAKAYKKNQ